MAATLRMARAHAGVSQRDVALRAGVSHWRLQQFEAARVEPTESELDAMARPLPILPLLLSGASPGAATMFGDFGHRSTLS